MSSEIGRLMFVVFTTVFFIFVSFVSGQEEVRDVYFFGEQVKVDLFDVFDFRAKISTPSTSYVYEGSNEVFVFRPEEVGEYVLSIYSEDVEEIFRFAVLAESSSEDVVLESDDFLDDEDLSDEFSSENVSAVESFDEKAEDFKQVIRIDEPVRWLERVNVSGQTRLKIPREGSNVSVYSVINSSKELLNATVERDGFFVATAREFVGQQARSDVLLENVSGEVEVEYYTPAPEVREKDFSDKRKEIVVSSPAGLHYEHVFSYTDISELTGDVDSIRVYWKEEDRFLDFEPIDVDGNGLFDRVEWIIPHLSEQTFEIIIITLAEHLDSEREFLEDIYDVVNKRDDVWQRIPAENYVRVSFEENLTSVNDITLYARSNESGRVVVYEKDGDSVIAEFEVIAEEAYYRVLLDDLVGSQDSFDLLILDGVVEFDLIIDPFLEEFAVIAQIYQTNILQDASSEISVQFDEESVVGSNFSHPTSTNLQFHEDGWYKVSYGCVVQEVPVGGGARTEMTGFLEQDGVEVVPSRTYTYLRDSEDSRDRGSLSAVTLVNVSAGNNVTLQLVDLFGAEQPDPEESCWLYAEKLRRPAALIRETTNYDHNINETDHFTQDFDEVVYEDSGNFTSDLTNNWISVDEDGWYKIYYVSGSEQTSGTSDNDRITPASYLYRNNSAELEPSMTYSYHKRADQAAFSSEEGYTIAFLNAGENISLRRFALERQQASALTFTLDDTWLLMERLEDDNVLLIWDSSGGQSVTSSSSETESAPANITWDSQVQVGANFSHSVGEHNFTIDEDGWFEISYAVSFDGSTSSNRKTSCAQVLRDGVVLEPSRLCEYERDNAVEDNSVAANFIVNNSAGSTYALQHTVTPQTAGAGHTLIADSSWISVVPVKIIAPDTTPPMVTIHFPMNVSYNLDDLPLLFNVSLDELGDDVLYSLDEGLHNISMSTNDNFYYNASNASLADGVYNFSVYANDSIGNRNDGTFVEFIFDSIAPFWFDLNTSNSTPSVGDSVSFWSFWNDSLAGLDSWVFSWNATLSGDFENVSSGTFSGFSNVSNVTELIPGFASGRVVGYQFYANDSTGNLNVSATGTIDVQQPLDTENPLIHSFGVTPGVDGYGQNFTLEANVSDNVALFLVQVNITHPNGSITFLTLDSTGGDLFSANFSDSWQLGSYTFRVFANDSAGNFNVSSDDVFAVQTNASIFLKSAQDVYGAHSDVELASAGGVWLYDAWRYRTPFNFSEESGSELSDFQVNVSFDTASLISSGKMNSDCSDIRFGDASDSILPYWIASGCNTGATQIWTKANLSASGSVVLHMYYGNSGAVSESNENATFFVVGEAGMLEVGGSDSVVQLQRNYSSPKVFATPTLGPGVSRTGGVTTQHHLVTNVGSDNFSVRHVESSTGGDSSIDVDNVTYFVFEEGRYDLGLRALDVDVGTTSSTGSYSTVSFNVTFSATPALISDTQTNVNGVDQIYARGDTLGTTSVQLQVEDDDVTTPSLSSAETIAYAAIEVGSESLNTFEASTVSGITHAFSTQNFLNSYGSAPYVMTHLNDEAGSNSFYSVSRGVTTSNFEIAGEEPASWDGNHIAEIMSWVAFEGELLLGTKYASSYPSYNEQSEEERTNVLENVGSTDLSGFLLMQIRRNGTDAFVSTQVDDVNTQTLRSVATGDSLDLSSLWNANPWNTASKSAGYYKVVAYLTDPNGGFLVNDTGGNISSEYVFFLDITPPTWSDFGANATSADPLESVLFNASWDDNGVLDRWEFWWNATGAWENVRNGSFSSTPDDSNTSEVIPSAAEATNFSFYFTGYDTTGARNSTENGSIFINDATAPSISAEGVSPGSANRNDAVLISATVTDNLAVDETWTFVGIPNGSTTNVSMPFISGALYRASYQSTEIGQYNATVYANDTSSNAGVGGTLVSWDVFGRSNVNLDSPSGESFALGSIIQTQCSVQDEDTGGFVANYPVAFRHGASLLGVNVTNSSGAAVFVVNTSGYSEGTNVLNCTIVNNATLYYNVNTGNDDVSISILYPSVEVSHLTHENLYEVGLGEYEAGDVLDVVNVTVNNTGGASAFGVNVTLEFIDENGDATDWSESEVVSCGDLSAGSSCEVSFGNGSSGYVIDENSLSRIYFFNVSIAWFDDGAGMSENASFGFLLHQPQDNFSSTLVPGKVIQNASASYNVSVLNPWSAALNDVNVTVSCPDENITCVCVGTSENYCDLTTISAGGSSVASFNVTTNSSTEPADYVLNATIQYSDPSGEFSEWFEREEQIMQVRGPTPFRVNVSAFSMNVTRGNLYDFNGSVNNTGVVSLNDVSLIWTLPTGWVNASGNLSNSNSSHAPGTLIFNHLVVNVSESSQLGEQSVELRANSSEVSDDFQNELVSVFADSFVRFVGVNESSVLRNEVVRFEGRLVYDNGSSVSSGDLSFFLDDVFVGMNATNSSGVAVLTALVPEGAPLGTNTVNVTHDGSGLLFTNPSFNDSVSLSVEDRIVFENISATSEFVGYGEEVVLGANVSSHVTLDSVFANVTYPNSSNILVGLDFVGGIRYEGNFSDSWQWGDYNYSIFANNTVGFSNGSIALRQFFVRANFTLRAHTDLASYFQNEDVLLSDSEWWNVSWGYKQFFNITNSYSEDLHEYQILLSIDTPSLFSEGKLRSDCGDMRFTWYNSSLGSEEEVPYYLDSCNVSSVNSSAWVQVPFVGSGSSQEIYFYYGSSDVSSASNVSETFSYSSERVVGYVVSDRMSSGNGGIISLSGGNSISVGSSTFSLGDRGTSSVPFGDLAQGNNVSTLSLFYLDSNVDATESISPISFAGTEFYYFSDRGTNNFAVVSPFGNASVRIYDDGTEVAGSPFSVSASSPTTISADIGNTNVVRVSSDIPILVQHHATTQDSMVYYPATRDYLYGIPSSQFQVGSGPNGSAVTWFTNGSRSGTPSLGADQGFEQGEGSAGTADAFRVNGSQPIGANQLADGDGSEATTFLPFRELGTRFGSFYSTEYIAVAAPVGGTNCTTYNSGGSPVESQVAPTSADEVHKLCFGCGSSTQYLTGGWTMSCSEPVFAYHEEDTTGDETNLFSWKQMRQYVYPEPVVGFGSEREASRAVNNNVTGSVYVAIDVQRNASGSWESVGSVVNDSDGGSARKVETGGILNLMEIYNPLAWNTRLNETGDYRVYVVFGDVHGNILRDDDGDFLNASAFFVIEDVVPPVVTLIYPENGTNFENDFVVPNFTYSVLESLIDSCELYGDWGSGWHANQSVLMPVADGTLVNFSSVSVLTDGFYLWNVRCNDTAGNVGWNDENLSFSAFFYPDEVVFVNVSQEVDDGSGNVTLFWENASHASSYRVYESSAVSGGFSLLGETSDLNFTDVGFSGNVRRFYRVDSLNPTGQNDSSDLFGAHVYTLRHSGNTRNWVGFPTNASYIVSANDSLHEIRNATSFTMWNATTQRRVTCNAFSCPSFPSCTDTNCDFDLEQGQGYEVHINGSAANATNWSLVGVVYGNRSVALVRNVSDFGKNWISLYANTSLSSAQLLIENVSGADAVTNWDAHVQTSQGLIPSPFPFGPSYLGTNFNTVIEKGYEVSVDSSVNWSQQ